jgi:Zn-dependent protease
MGRMSLNPLKHIDPFGTILIPILLYFATSGAFLFGYAKPVPINFGRLRKPKRHGLGLAGRSGCQFLMALLDDCHLRPGAGACKKNSSPSWPRPAC